MHLHEHTIDTRSDSGARQQRDELGLPTAYCRSAIVGRRGKLHRMCRVEDHRRELAHDGQRTHVNHQIVVAERSAAFGEKDALAAGLANFVDRVTHVPRRDELPLLDVDCAAALPRRYEQVGLAAEKGRDLKDVYCFGHAWNIGGFVDVSKHGNLHCLGDLAEDARTFFQPRVRESS